MELNPCLSCIKKDQNKNNPVCRDCNKRIDYVNGLERNLNFTASHGDCQFTSHRFTFFSSELSTLSHQGDAIY